MKYLGDGNSKAYVNVKDMYKDGVQKYECVRHYQKTYWYSFTKVKKKYERTKPLTGAVIDKLQNYFGIALRAKTGGTTQ